MVFFSSINLRIQFSSTWPEMILHVCMKPPVSGRIQHVSRMTTRCFSDLCYWLHLSGLCGSLCDTFMQHLKFLAQDMRRTNEERCDWRWPAVLTGCLFFSSFPETLLRSWPRGKSKVRAKTALFKMLCSHLLTSAVSNAKITNKALTVPKLPCQIKVNQKQFI